jgi:hypothetical protein
MKSLALLGAVLTLPMARAASGPDEESSQSRKAWIDTSDGEAPSYSIHEEQMLELGKELDRVTDDEREIRALEVEGKLFPAGAAPKEILQTRARGVGKDFIVFGYAQSENQIMHTRWQGLTHIGCRFIYFNASGGLTSTSNFTGRSSYLKAGGAAQAAGVKVLMVVASFEDESGGAIETVMTSSSLRAVLINNIVTLLRNDTYSHGVSMDLEFSWGTTVRDGITAFMRELRAALDAVNPDYELSIYTNAIFSSSQWNFDAVTGITPHIDYMTYSMYDWGSGLTPHAISDFNNCLGSSKMHAYLNQGLPPEKLVLTISAYSRKWAGTTSYNVAGTSSASQGFTDGLYDTSLNPNYSGPYANHYVTGDEGAWYTYNSGSDYTVTWDSPEAMEYKIRHALSMQDPNGTWSGRRLGGVGFWSLYWMAEASSYDPRTSSSVSRTRTYPHVYQICQEVLAEPGQERFVIEGFEGLDPRWRDPNEAKDTTGDTDGDSAIALVSAPAGTGKPLGTVNALRATFDFESSGSNRAVYAHELLASDLAISIPDLNATLAHFDSTTKVMTSIYTPAAYSGYQVRMMAVDRDGELEISDPYSLNASGWRTLEWDLTDAGQVNAFNTSEPAFKDGDGTLDTAGDEARDIGFVGFLVEGSGARSGYVVFDEIAWEHANPGGKNYTINEFRYDLADSEFIEIHGPAGTMPAGLQIRIYSGSDGSVTKTIALGGRTIPDDGGGSGFFVVGDPGVPNVDYSTSFGAAVDDIPNLNPTGLQLYDPASGCAYDSAVYEAFGGLGDLIRQQTHGVTDHGYPWMGQIARGTDASGQPYTLGRYPDGANTFLNAKDFSFMTATPGAANGGKIVSNRYFDFNSVPEGAFQTFESFRVMASAVGASAGGGNVHRCVDTSGGGVISVLGDAALGSDGKGYRVQGEIYIPGSGEPAQAIGIGFCGSQGSVFFASDSSGFGYESGYWLIYENASGVGLADGRADHPGTFEFVHATHDNMDGFPVDLLGSKTLASTGAAAGAWTTFALEVNPESENPLQQLTATINNVVIYQGALPSGGPVSGAIQVGFRENHTGNPVATEGTWIDSVSVTLLSTPVIPGWGVY